MDTVEELLKITSGNEQVTQNTSGNFNSNVIKSTTKSAKDDEELKDRASNRNQREEFTKKILIMMACELIFIAFLLLGVFVVPFYNSLAPKIQINLPPLFITSSIILALAFIYKFLGNFTIIIYKSFNIPIAKILKLLFVLIILFVLNIMHRQPYTLYYSPIHLSENIINMILYASITVFVKTTILAGLIINGLYDVLKKK